MKENYTTNEVIMARFLDRVNTSRQVAARFNAPSQLAYLESVNQGTDNASLSQLATLFPVEQGDCPDMGPTILMIYDHLERNKVALGLQNSIAGMAMILGRPASANHDALRERAQQDVVRSNRAIGVAPARAAILFGYLAETLKEDIEPLAVTWDDIRRELPGAVEPARADGAAPIAMPSGGMMKALQMRANELPWGELFGRNQGVIIIRGLLQLPPTLTVNLVNENISVIEDRLALFNASWGRLTYQQMHNVYWSAHLQNPSSARDIMAAASLILTTSMVKANVTGAWITRRVAAFCQTYKRNDMVVTNVTPAVVTEARGLLQPDKQNLRGLIGSLLYIYYMARHNNLEVLTWIIEQARGSNSASLAALAELSVKNAIATYTVYSTVLGLRADLDVAILAMAQVIDNPYSTLARPAAASSTFPDLAYLATSSLKKATGNVDGFKRNDDTNRCKLPVAVLKQWMSIFRSAETQQGADAMNIQNIARAYGVSVSEAAVEDELAAIRLDVVPVVAAGVNAGDQAMNPEQQELLNRGIENLPYRSARAMRGSVRTTGADIINTANLPIDNTFKNLCNMFIRATSQRLIDLDTFATGAANGAIHDVLLTVAEFATLNQYLTELNLTPLPRQTVLGDIVQGRANDAVLTDVVPTAGLVPFRVAA